MSFSAFLTGTVLVSSLTLTGLLAAPQRQAASRLFATIGGVALVVVGFVGGLALAN